MSDISFPMAVVTGLIVFVGGQVFLKFHLEPIQNYKRLRGEIADALLFYANVYSDKGDAEKKKEAHAVLRDKVAKLTMAAHLIPAYRFYAFIRLVPSVKTLKNVRGALIRLSHTAMLTLNPGPPVKGDDAEDDSDRCEERIKAGLGLMQQFF